MQTKTKQPQELLEITEDMATTTRPPDRVILPVTQEAKAPAIAQPLEVLSQLGDKIRQLRSIEPPPRKPPAQPRVHQRPTRGFD